MCFLMKPSDSRIVPLVSQNLFFLEVFVTIRVVDSKPISSLEFVLSFLDVFESANGIADGFRIIIVVSVFKSIFSSYRRQQRLLERLYRADFSWIDFDSERR